MAYTDEFDNSFGIPPSPSLIEDQSSILDDSLPSISEDDGEEDVHERAYDDLLVGLGINSARYDVHTGGDDAPSFSSAGLVGLGINCPDLYTFSEGALQRWDQ